MRRWLGSTAGRVVVVAVVLGLIVTVGVVLVFVFNLGQGPSQLQMEASGQFPSTSTTTSSSTTSGRTDSNGGTSPGSSSLPNKSLLVVCVDSGSAKSSKGFMGQQVIDPDSGQVVATRQWPTQGMNAEFTIDGRKTTIKTSKPWYSDRYVCGQDTHSLYTKDYQGVAVIAEVDGHTVPAVLRNAQTDYSTLTFAVNPPDRSSSFEAKTLKTLDAKFQPGTDTLYWLADDSSGSSKKLSLYSHNSPTTPIRTKEVHRTGNEVGSDSEGYDLEFTTSGEPLFLHDGTAPEVWQVHRLDTDDLPRTERKLHSRGVVEDTGRRAAFITEGVSGSRGCDLWIMDYPNGSPRKLTTLSSCGRVDGFRKLS